MEKKIEKRKKEFKKIGAVDLGLNMRQARPSGSAEKLLFVSQCIRQKIILYFAASYLLMWKITRTSAKDILQKKKSLSDHWINKYSGVDYSCSRKSDLLNFLVNSH
jgi:hypothetical protein